MYPQMTKCARKTSARYAIVILTREETGKNVTGTVEVCKKDEQLKKTRGYPYMLCCEMEVASLFNTSLVSGCDQTVFRLYFS